MVEDLRYINFVFFYILKNYTYPSQLKPYLLCFSNFKEWKLIPFNCLALSLSHFHFKFLLNPTKKCVTCYACELNCPLYPYQSCENTIMPLNFPFFFFFFSFSKSRIAIGCCSFATRKTNFKDGKDGRWFHWTEKS
jgi:hypothetical protein